MLQYLTMEEQQGNEQDKQPRRERVRLHGVRVGRKTEGMIEKDKVESIFSVTVNKVK